MHSALYGPIHVDGSEEGKVIFGVRAWRRERGSARNLEEEEDEEGETRLTEEAPLWDVPPPK